MTEIRTISQNLQRALTGVIVALALQACGASSDSGLKIIGNGVEEVTGNVEQATGFGYVPELNIPYQPYVPELGPAIPAAAQAALVSADLPYPAYNSHDIKAIGPDAWLDRDQLVEAGIGGVIFNQLWSTWQPSSDLSLSEANTFEYDGMVWRVDPVRENQIRWYSERGIKVSVVLFATPEWARQSNTAKYADVSLIDPKFIASDNPADFARFAGMIAKRFNGANGNGRVVNFIIQNEVNSLAWYNPGCGATGHECDIEDRIQNYAADFNMAYDRILQEQSNAHVFFSFDHHFGYDYHNTQPFSSAQRFIETLDPMVSPREWRVAFHSYPGDLFVPTFGPYDYPKVTFGNIGVLAGFLRQKFPDKPHTWDIHLTENGLNAGAGSSQELQNSQMSVATRNVLGTPGISNYVYHRMRDHYQEADFQPGLHDIDDQPKAAWYTWASDNLYAASPPKLAAGYEDLPYVKVTRSVNSNFGHWASSRQAPAGYTGESAYLLLRDKLPNTKMLYECHVSNLNVTRLTRDLSCGGDEMFGPVGYVYDFNNIANTRLGLYSINIASGDHILTTNPNEIAGDVTVLGFVDATKVLSQPTPQRDLSYFSTEYSKNTSPAGVQAAPGQVINSLEECGDATQSCNVLRFAVDSGLTSTLHCQVQDQAQGLADIVLSYGSNLFTRSVDIEHYVDPLGDTYTLSLPIEDRATWATVVISSKAFQSTNHCVVVQDGELLIGAAQEIANNLLQNGGFESSLTDWGQCAGDGSTSFSIDAYAGVRAVEVGSGNCVYQEVAVDVGNEYQLSCQAQHTGPGVGTVKLAFATDGFQTLSESELVVNTTAYDNYSISAIAPVSSVYAVVLFNSEDGTGLLDGCSLVVVE